jgi:Family of unknown function (DUF6130)/Phenazine biosynthesis-like protein
VEQRLSSRFKVIQYRTENLHIVPEFGPAALALSPQVGHIHMKVDEDPATGSILCTLAPYWAGRLGKGTLRAQQLSARGGYVQCTIGGDRAKIAGKARLYLHGTLDL